MKSLKQILIFTDNGAAELWHQTKVKVISQDIQISNNGYTKSAVQSSTTEQMKLYPFETHLLKWKYALI